MSGDRSQYADSGGFPPGSEDLAEDIADRYRVHVDRASPSGRLRYIAVARRLDTRPYAIVTSDRAELLQALGSWVHEPGTPESARQAAR